MLQFFKRPASLLILCIAFATAPVSAGGDHTPKHGGVMVETKAGDMEIVAKPDSIQIYFTEHGKAVKFEGAKAKVTLLSGTEKTEANLVETGDKVEVKGVFKVAKGTKGIAVLMLAGKPPVTARFDIR